jgi:hypothetical protein
VGLGGQARIEDGEALLLVHGDACHTSGALLSVRTELAPSVDHVSVVDTFVTAGAGYSFTPAKRVRIDLLATAGVLAHGWRYQGHGSGAADFTASLPVTLAIAVAPRIELGITALVGVSMRGRRHFDASGTLWKRSPWRAGGLLSVRFLLGRKPARAKMADGP